MKELNKKFQRYLLIVLGIIMIILYIWFRFIRTRIPREIPFNLSYFGFFILIFICIIYINSLILQIRKKNFDNEGYVVIIYNFLIIPLIEFDKELKKFFKSINVTLLQIIERLQLIKIKVLIIGFDLLPRISICIVLVIETFYFHYLFFFYKVIILGIFILIEKYIFYSLKKIKEDYLLYIEDIFTIEMEYKYAIELINMYPELLPQYYDDEEEDYIYFEMLWVPIKEFFFYQKSQYSEKGIFVPYRVGIKNLESYRKLHNVSKTNNFKTLLDLSNKDKKIVDYILNNIIMEINYDYIISHNIIKKIKIILLVSSLTCWLYMLIVSLPYLYEDIFYKSIIFTLTRSNPFID
jgi:hypothetical protein